MQTGIIKFIKDLNKKAEEKYMLILLELGHPSSPVPLHGNSLLISGLWILEFTPIAGNVLPSLLRHSGFLRPQTGSYIIISPGFQALELGLNQITTFLILQLVNGRATSQHIWCLCDCISKISPQNLLLHINNLDFYIYTYLYPFGSVGVHISFSLVIT